MNQQEKEELRIDRAKRKTLNLSIKEGNAASIMSGVGDSYVSPFALVLGANNLQIGLLSSFIGLFSPISQFLGTKLMEKHSRKKIIITAVTLQALTWLPLVLLSIFFIKDIFKQHLASILIIFYSLYAIFGAIAGPSWFSLLGDIVPENHRGAYFSKRNKICGAVALFSMLIAAFVLDYFKTRGYVLVAFSIFFIIAAISRLVSANLFKKHYYPEFELKKDYYFSFFEFIKKAPTNNFGKFAIYVALMHFAIQIAGPFFTVYMLRDLGLSYLMFTMINASASIFSLLSLTLWGKISDKYGNRETLKLGSFLISLLPILWIFSPNPLYLILIPQLIAGVGWAAFNLSASNFIYDSVSPQRRGLCLTYYNLLSGIGIFTGAALGGLIANSIKIPFMNKLLFIFLLSGILRLVISTLMLPKIKEIRTKVKKPKKHMILYFRELRPMRAGFHEITQLTHTVKSLGQKSFTKI